MPGMSMAGMQAMNTGMSIPTMQSYGSGMPGMNLGDSAAPVASAPPASGSYRCEMHPNIVSARPGTCPVCHMALTR